MSVDQLSQDTDSQKPMCQRVMINKSNGDEVILSMWPTIQVRDDCFETRFTIHINGEKVYAIPAPGGDGLASILSAIEGARIYFDAKGLSKDLQCSEPGALGIYSHGIPYFHSADMHDYTALEGYKKTFREDADTEE